MYCCVPFCKSTGKGKGVTFPPNIKISFHEFPVDEDLYRQWLRRIARKDFVPNDKSGSSVVCSKHFTPEDFVPRLKISRLKKNAVPTIFPMYPSYALLPPPKNSSSLSRLNHVKTPYIRKNGSKSSRKQVDPAILFNFEINSHDHHNEDRAFIKEANKNQYDSSHLLQTLNHLKKLSTENSKTKDVKGIASDSETTSTSPKQPGMVQANKNLTASNRSNSFANFNHTKILLKEENKIENSTKKDGTGIVADLNMISTNNTSPEHPNVMHVITINESKKDHPSAIHSLFNYQKKQSVSVSQTDNLTEKNGTGIASNSGMTFTNNNSSQQPSLVGIFMIDEERKDSPASNNSCSLVGLKHPKRQSVGVSKTEDLTEKDGPGIAINCNMISTNRISLKQPSVVRVLTLNESKEDPPAANNSHSLVGLNHLNKMSFSVSGIEDLTEKHGTGIAINSSMTFTNINSPRHHSVCTTNVTKKDLPTTKNSCSLIGINRIKKNYIGSTFNSDMTSKNKNCPGQKKVRRVTTLNDLIHKSVTEKSREIRNLKSLLRKKNQKLEKMKEEISNLEEKVAIYETDDHHEILRKMSALKENSPQSIFFMDQMNNFFKKRPSWRESTIRECASWIAFSPKSYEFVRDRKLMVLPSKATLLRYAYSGEKKRQKMDTCHLGSCQAESPGKLAVENSALEH